MRLTEVRPPLEVVGLAISMELFNWFIRNILLYDFINIGNQVPLRGANSAKVRDIFDIINFVNQFFLELVTEVAAAIR